MKDFLDSQFIFLNQGPELGDVIAAQERVLQEPKEGQEEQLVAAGMIEEAITKMRTRIDTCPVSQEHQKEIHARLDDVLNKRAEDLKKTQITTQAELDKLAVDITAELTEFDKSTGIDEANKLASKKEEIVRILDLETYKSEGGYWESINAKIKQTAGVDDEGIKKLQKLIGVQDDGKMGPETINAISNAFGLGIKVKLGDSTKYKEEEKSEETKREEFAKELGDTANAVLKGAIEGVEEMGAKAEEEAKEAIGPLLLETGVRGVARKDKILKAYDGNEQDAAERIKLLKQFIPDDMDLVINMAIEAPKASPEILQALSNFAIMLKKEGANFSQIDNFVRIIRKDNSVTSKEALIVALSTDGPKVAEFFKNTKGKGFDNVIPFLYADIDHDPVKATYWMQELQRNGYSDTEAYQMLKGMFTGSHLDKDTAFNIQMSTLDFGFDQLIISLANEGVNLPTEVTGDPKFKRPLLNIARFKNEYGVNLFEKGSVASKDAPVDQIKEDIIELDLVARFAQEHMPPNSIGFEFAKYVIDRTSNVDMETFSNFWTDPALETCILAYKQLPDKDVSKALKIGRAIFLSGFQGEVTAETVQQYNDNIEQGITELQDVPLFEGSNVLLVSNNETWENGKKRFGTQNMVDGLTQSVGKDGNAEHLTVEEPTPEELAKLKTQVLDKIAKTKPPFRFVFDGHGLEDKLILNNAEQGEDLKEYQYISTEELANAIIQRYENFQGREDELKHDVYILSSCMNHTFIRNAMQIVQSKNIGAIFLGESEYGQYAFSQRKWNREASKVVLGIGESGVTLGGVIAREKTYTASDYTIYAPNQGGKFQQLADAKDTKRKEDQMGNASMAA